MSNANKKKNHKKLNFKKKDPCTMKYACSICEEIEYLPNLAFTFMDELCNEKVLFNLNDFIVCKKCGEKMNPVCGSTIVIRADKLFE